MSEHGQVSLRVAIGVDRGWALVLVAILVLVNLVYPSRVWVILLWTVGGLAALGYYWIRQLARSVLFRRELRAGWVEVGDRLEERFTLVNRSWLPLLWAEISDGSDLPGYIVGRVASCGGAGTRHWTTSAVCSRRGVFTLGPWRLHIQDPFGFFSATVCDDETEVIIVHPPVVYLPEITLPMGLMAGSAPVRRRAVSSTVETSRTRLYVPGDPLHHVHWPSTAHHGELIVRESEAQVSGDLWIILDLDQSVQVGQGVESTQEYGVILAASLADRALRQNRAVGLVAHGVELVFMPPGKGKAQMWRILRALARVRVGGRQHLAQVLRSIERNMGRQTTVLIITPSCASGWVDALLLLTRRGIAPTVVLVDPDSFVDVDAPRAPTPVPRVQAAREFLADAGITVHVITQGYPFRYVTQPERRGHWEFKVTPMGRAIVVRRPEWQ